MYIGANELEKVYIGTTELEKIYLGQNLVYQSSPQTPLQFQMVGNVQIDSNNVASGFSDDNYLTTDNILNYATFSFEVNTAIKLNTTSDSNYGIIDTWGANTHNIRLTTSATNTIRLRISTVGSETYAVDIVGGTTIPLDTKFYIKATYSALSGYKLYTSLDKSNWTLEGQSATTTPPYLQANSQLIIGDNAATGYYLDGSIYLQDTTIEVQGLYKETVGAEYDIVGLTVEDLQL